VNPRAKTGGNGRDPATRAFCAADDLAVELFRVARRVERSGGADLAVEMRRSASKCGAALVTACAVTGTAGSRRPRILEARDRLLEVRYHLHLARRLGLLEAGFYRRSAGAHESALRALENWLRTDCDE